MIRFFSRKLLLLLVPVALFFGGVAAAWAFDSSFSCDEAGEERCCCCAAGEAKFDTPEGRSAANRTASPGPCGTPKNDCGCGNDDRPAPAPDAFRLAKPARLIEEPDLLSDSTIRHKAQAPYHAVSLLRSKLEKVGASPEYYLRNSSFLC